MNIILTIKLLKNAKYKFMPKWYKMYFLTILWKKKHTKAKVPQRPQKSCCGPDSKASTQSSVSLWSLSHQFVRIVAFVRKLTSGSTWEKWLHFCHLRSSVTSSWKSIYIGVCQRWRLVALAGFPGKESACNTGNPSSIPGSGRSPGESIGYALQYSWASLVAQMVKNLPAMQETWVQSLGWEDALEERMAIRSSILAWSIPMDSGACGHKEADVTGQMSTAQCLL